MASTTPNRVSTLMEKSSRYITKNIPTSDTGMATTGMSVERQSRKNKKIITTTSPNASRMVCSTSEIEALNENGVIKAAADFQVFGQVGFVLLHPLVELLGDVNLVRARLGHDGHAHQRQAVAAQQGLVVFGVQLGVAHVRKPHQRKRIIADDEAC